MKSDILRELDPRKSYLPAPGPQAEAAGGSSRLAEHLATPLGSARSLPVASLSIADIRAELERREKAATGLQLSREKLVAEIDALDREIEKLTGVVGTVVASGTSPKRTRNAPVRRWAIPPFVRHEPAYRHILPPIRPPDRGAPADLGSGVAGTIVQ